MENQNNLSQETQQLVEGINQLAQTLENQIKIKETKIGEDAKTEITLDLQT